MVSDVIAALFFLEQKYLTYADAMRPVEGLDHYKPRALAFLKAQASLSKAQKTALLVLQVDEVVYVRNGIKMVTDALYAVTEEAIAHVQAE